MLTVGLTADFFDDSGRPKFSDMGLDVLAGTVSTRRFSDHRPEITPDQLQGCAGAIVLTPRVTAASVADSSELLAIARFGVGYDSVDVAACTAQDVLVTITAGAVDRPVAEATVGWMIALSHHMLIKDRLVRTGDWHARTRCMGSELRDRTLGVIGFGGIGRKLTALLSGFGMRQPLVYDPFAPPEVLAEHHVHSVSLEELLQQADFVSVHCPLNESTRGLLGARELALMKPTAFLLNTARGGIVDENALFDVLQSEQIAGAALDCFEIEPVLTPHRFGQLDNVLLAPHSIAWTEELFRDIGRMACSSLLQLAHGQRPRGVLNPELFQRESFCRKWMQVTGLSRVGL
ncbi:MAG: NAD(P)-dependent oxidoreductase [Planctomycetota bacterium]